MKRPTDNYILTRADAERISDAVRATEQRIGHIKARHRRRVVASGKAGGGGTPNRNAWCAADAGSGKTIVCWLDVDASEAETWEEGMYDKDGIVTHEDSAWISTEDDNDGEPGDDERWRLIEEITVHCTLIGTSKLVDCFPTLEIGVGPMPVWKDGATWRSLWWFQGHEECPEPEEEPEE